MNDNVKEGAESFSISITAKGAKIASGSFTKTITIVDDESPFISIYAPSYKVAEDANNFTFNIRVSGPHSGITVRYFTSAETAISNVDYDHENFHFGFGNSPEIGFPTRKVVIVNLT